MTMTKYHPIYEVNKIIKGYSVKYNKGSHAHSLWYFNSEHTELIICTDKPGIWVGKAGKDIDQLKGDLNVAIANRNATLQLAYEQGRLTLKPNVVPQIAVSLIECNF